MSRHIKMTQGKGLYNTTGYWFTIEKANYVYYTTTIYTVTVTTTLPFVYCLPVLDPSSYMY